jgi:hypothetical protein
MCLGCWLNELIELSTYFRYRDVSQSSLFLLLSSHTFYHRHRTCGGQPFEFSAPLPFYLNLSDLIHGLAQHKTFARQGGALGKLSFLLSRPRDRINTFRPHEDAELS